MLTSLFMALNTIKLPGLQNLAVVPCILEGNTCILNTARAALLPLLELILDNDAACRYCTCKHEQHKA